MAVRRSVVVGILAAGAVLTPGCSWLNPYGQLRLGKDEDALTALYPHLGTEPARLPAGTPASAPLDGDLDFLGALPAQIQRTEARRGELIVQVDNMEGVRTAYDTALWTIAPWLVYRLVSPGMSDLNVQHQLAGGTAGLAAWKLSLDARTADAPDLYGQTAFGLGCAIIHSGRYLFTRAELDGRLWDGLPLVEALPGPGLTDPEWRQRLHLARLPDWRDLPRAQADLRDEELRIEKAIRLLPTGERSASCATPGSADCRARNALVDRGGVDRDAQARDLEQQWLAIDRYVREVRARLNRLLVQVDHGAALDLSQETSVQMERLRDQLRLHGPQLGSLSALVTSLGAQAQDAAASAAAAAASAASAAQEAASAAQDVASAAKAGPAKAQSRTRSTVASHHVKSPDEIVFDLHGIVLVGATLPRDTGVIEWAPNAADGLRRGVAVIGPDLGATAKLDDLAARVRYEVQRAEDLLDNAKTKAANSNAALRRFKCPSDKDAAGAASPSNAVAAVSPAVQVALPTTLTSLP